MATRSVIVVIDKAGETKICQFGLNDGQFRLGLKLLELLRDKSFVDKLELQLSKTKFIERKDVKNKNRKIYCGGIDSNVKAKLLENIVNSKESEIHLIEDDFSDCEYIYILNYKDNSFSVKYYNDSETYELSTISFSINSVPTNEQFLSMLPEEYSY